MMSTSFSAEEKLCCTCAHFFRHYTKGPRSYIPTDFGHCPYPRIKIRTLRDSCPRWKAKKPSPDRP